VTLEAVVFDFDGVIANSEPLHYRGFRDILARHGLELSEADYYGRYLGYDDAGAFAAIAADREAGWTNEQIAEAVRQKAHLLEELERQQSTLFPGAPAAIERLAACCPLAIASGALKSEITHVLDRHDLKKYFPVIVSAEDTPSSKPAPDPYLRAVERLAALGGTSLRPDRCVAVEDSQWGLLSARAAGLRTVAITHTYARTALTADVIISHLDDLTVTLLDELTAPRPAAPR
jgi:HAD superfamily hydrolase (TIGR01509 family)